MGKNLIGKWFFVIIIIFDVRIKWIIVSVCYVIVDLWRLAHSVAIECPNALRVTYINTREIIAVVEKATEKSSNK